MLPRRLGGRHIGLCKPPMGNHRGRLRQKI
nr:MAG TPA: hypothetical protein [Siphoviridae sp. ctJbC4]